ncbi:MAG: RNA polymerase sigma factor [Pseudomonadales bacterium]
MMTTVGSNGSKLVAEAETPEDIELLRMVANKNKRAFEVLYKRYYHRIAQFAVRIVRQPDIAEEVVGDTMFAIWRSAAAFEGRSNVSTWLLGIAYRRALKTLQRNRKHQIVDSDDEVLGKQPDTHPDTNPEEVSNVDNLQQVLHKGIENLSDDHRVAMQMTAMGYSYGEISEIVGCPHNTVKTRVFHARRQLRGFLAQTEGPTMAAERSTRSCTS